MLCKYFAKDFIFDFNSDIWRVCSVTATIAMSTWKKYFEIGGGDLSFRISLKNELCSTDCTQWFRDCSSLGIISNIRNTK